MEIYTQLPRDALKSSRWRMKMKRNQEDDFWSFELCRENCIRTHTIWSDQALDLLTLRKKRSECCVSNNIWCFGLPNKQSHNRIRSLTPAKKSPCWSFTMYFEDFTIHTVLTNIIWSDQALDIFLINVKLFSNQKNLFYNPKADRDLSSSKFLKGFHLFETLRFFENWSTI